ncbi:MAG: TIGR01244 family sulfur transferase [Pseudomonadota bacterium]
MDMRSLSPSFAVAPQILPEDVPTLVEAGVTAVICNRPDMENPVELRADVLRAAVEAAGLAFHDNPVVGGGLSLADVEAQARVIAETEGTVLAYCASGTRSAILWAFAIAGRVATDDILSALSQAGYQLEGMRPQLDALAAQR